jgi:pimeloyl-ACP methyl ester carboxylesterase
VSASGYNVQDVRAAAAPKSPQVERTLWYQFYLHGERGRAGLAANRGDYARLLCHEWSPTWTFTDGDFEASRSSFDSPDVVDVSVHSYRHRFGLVNGDPAYQASEERMAPQPVITVPRIVLDGVHDTVTPPRPRDQHQQHFASLIDYRCVDAGHNLPQENPVEFARAVTDLRSILWRRRLPAVKPRADSRCPVRETAGCCLPRRGSDRATE